MFDDYSDVLAHLEQKLADARAIAARAADRAAALVELRSKALEVAQRNDLTTLTADQLWDAVDDEHERAELAAIVDRALPAHDH